MDDSILLTIKQMLGLGANYDAFDAELPFHINSAMMVANQLGIGRSNYLVTGYDQTWTGWLGTEVSNLGAIQQYIYMRVRLTWDPPANSFVVNSLEKQIDELTWRLNVQAEAVTTNE